MNQRSAFSQRQDSPIKDNKSPPTQGLRGEKAADESPAGDQQRCDLAGTDAQIEIVSGTAFVDSGGSDASANQPAVDRSEAPSSLNVSKAPHSDGVSDLHMGAQSPGGESAGAPYPSHRNTPTQGDDSPGIAPKADSGRVQEVDPDTGEVMTGEEDDDPDVGDEAIVARTGDETGESEIHGSGEDIIPKPQTGAF